MGPDDREFPNRMRRIEALVQALEACPDPAAREAARELVRALLDLHAAGLAKMLDLAAQPGETVGERFGRDPLVASLLLLHGLHPIPVADRVARSVERLARNGDVELLEATEQRVRVRLRGDPSAGPTLRRAVEAAILEAAPDVSAVVVEESWDRAASGRVPLPLLGGGVT
jgi:hypothetical protein